MKAIFPYRPKFFKACTGFEPMTSAIPVKIPYRPEFFFFRPYFHYCSSSVHYWEDRSRRRSSSIISIKQYNHCSHILQLIPQLVAKISFSSSHTNFSSLEHTNIHSQTSSLKIFVPALTNEPAFNWLQRTLATSYKTRSVV